MTTAPRGECRELVEEVSAYLDGELPPPDCRRIEQHCAGCPECSALVDGLRRTIGLCHEVGQAPLPESVRAAARSRVRELLAGTRRSSRRRRR